MKFHASSNLTRLSRILTNSQREKILKLLLQDFSFYVLLVFICMHYVIICGSQILMMLMEIVVENKKRTKDRKVMTY
jgi:2-phospho-L-lactate guanylyltransferase (CobY/MobA/RfbA family)